MPGKKKDIHPDLAELGTLFRKFRKRDEYIYPGRGTLQLSMLDYARLADVSWATIQNMESGKGFPSVPIWCKICTKLQIRVEDLLLSEEATAPLNRRMAHPSFELTPESMGAVLKSYRQRKEWKIADAWKASNISKASLQRLEKGSGEAYFISLVRLLEVYEISLPAFLSSAEKRLYDEEVEQQSVLDD